MKLPSKVDLRSGPVYDQGHLCADSAFAVCSAMEMTHGSGFIYYHVSPEVVPPPLIPDSTIKIVQD
jgi:hypothetical protein